jgi:hypothetical protein
MYLSFRGITKKKENIFKYFFRELAPEQSVLIFKSCSRNLSLQAALFGLLHWLTFIVLSGFIRK